MRNILADEEKGTSMGKILIQFKYHELEDPKTRKRLEKKIIDRFGEKNGYQMIRLLEDSNLLPKVINNNLN